MEGHCLSCNNISFSIGEQEILRDISFTLFREEIIALVGPNGVGKSTLLKIVAGLQKPNRGKSAFIIVTHDRYFMKRIGDHKLLDLQ